MHESDSKFIDFQEQAKAPYSQTALIQIPALSSKMGQISSRVFVLLSI